MKTSAPPLTSKEKMVLEFIEVLLAERGISPSYQEIKDHFGFASFNSVQNYLKQLQSKGYILIPAHQKRAIQILRPSAFVQEQIKTLREKNQVKNETVHSKDFSPSQSDKYELELPLLGKVAAGQPLEAFIENETISVPRALLRNPDKSFALKVIGQSMIEDGIFDGDYILVQKQSNATNGEIIVATVEQESTVKRFFYRSQIRDSEQSEKKIELRPANSSLQSMWYKPEEVKIQGVVVGLIRKF